MVEGSGDFMDWDTDLIAPEMAGNEIALTRPRPGQAYFWRLRAQETSGVAGGRNFLRDSQSRAGSWSPGGGGVTLASSQALEGLKPFRQTGPGIGDVIELGFDALTVASVRNNDELARTIIALAEGDRPVESQVDSLLDSQNPRIFSESSLGYPGSGWGIADEFGDTTIDTALALRALAVAGVPGGLSLVDVSVPAGQTSASHSFVIPPGSTAMFLDVQEVTGNARFTFTQPGGSLSFFDATPGGGPVSVSFGIPAAGTWSLAITNTTGAAVTFSASVRFTTAEGFDVSRLTTAATYLALAQNPDGGWGISPGDDSHLMITHEVMKALAARGAGLNTALNAGANWLLGSKRNPDGGFSSEPGVSNTLETAMAVVAIRLSSVPAALGNALAFIDARQLLNGSWENDPHITSLALQALARPPEISPIPNQSVLNPAPFAQIQLDHFVTDSDHADSEIFWSVSGQSALTVSIVNRVATITYLAGTELSEVLTFTATDPDGLSASTEVTFSVSLTPPVDHVIPRGGVVTGTRSFTTTPANFDQISFYTETPPVGIASGVVYSTTGVGLIPPNTVEVEFRIEVSGSAPLGIEQFSVEFELFDGNDDPLEPLVGNNFDFTIQITP